MRKIFLALYILILLTSISLACETTTVSGIAADPHKFDGKEVCVEGLVSNLKFKTSKRGIPIQHLGSYIPPWQIDHSVLLNLSGYYLIVSCPARKRA